MTAATSAGVRPQRATRWAALALILPALAFGIPTPFVIDHVRRTGELPLTPFGFRSHAGPFFDQLGPDGFGSVAWAFVVVCLLDVLAGAWLWQGRRRGALLGAAMTPLTLVFALGFAFPFLLLALPIRLVLLAAARAGLR
jgi:hypothetical protein